MGATSDRFKDRVAIVTGASRGIGRAIASRLAGEGASVLLTGRTSETLDEAVAAIRASGGRAAGVVAPAHEPESVQAIVHGAITAYGHIDHLVNNVGISTTFGPLAEAHRDRAMRMFDVNAWVPVALVQAALSAGLGNRDGASVVNISSIGARQVQPMVGPYIASKAAMEVLSRVLARELGPRGVRVNVVAPGLVRTDLSQVMLEGGGEKSEAAILPLQRVGEVNDIADAVAFALSSEAAWMTGMTIDVDGGRMLVGDEQPSRMIGVFDRSGARDGTAVEGEP